MRTCMEAEGRTTVQSCHVGFATVAGQTRACFQAHEVCPADAAKPAQQDCTHVRNIVMGKQAHDERSNEQGNGVHDE